VPDADGDADGEAGGFAEAPGLTVRLGDGVAEPGESDGFCDAERDGEAGGDDSGRCVDDARASTAPAAIGTARGGSYAVPAITVCTPHHDSVTAAPVASSQAAV
jgi:hypothetical protein